LDIKVVVEQDLPSNITCAGHQVVPSDVERSDTSGDADDNGDGRCRLKGQTRWRGSIEQRQQRCQRQWCR
jgi:hypothetical protein